MTFDAFLNPPTENFFVHLQLTNDEILETVEHVDENEEQEAEINVPSSHLNSKEVENSNISTSHSVHGGCT
jgi:hypothetical protein